MRFLAALVLILALAAPGGAQGESRRALSGLFGGPFALTDHNGRAVTEATFAGRHQLIYFGYTYCPDICPIDLTAVASALDDLGDLADKLHVLFITVDPARDTADALREYVGAFHPRILGLTGAEPAIAAVAKAWRVHRRVFRVEGAAAGDYYYDHSSLSYLMGPDGAFVTIFPHGTAPERLAEILRNHLSKSG